MAPIYNLTIDQGATFVRTFTWTDAAGDPIDVTGYSAEFQVRESTRSPDVVLSASTAGSTISVSGGDGEFTITIPASSTRSVPEGSYVYDVEITSPGGVVTRLVQGAAIVSGEVTR